MPINYEQIPEELKWTAQWCVAGADEHGKYKLPHAFNHEGRLYRADPTDARQRSDFESVVDFAEANPPHGVGFVLAATDPYVCIDLDVKNAHNEPHPEKWTSQSDIDRFNKIIAAFNSYTERSMSGQGYHIWLRGYVGKGCRRSGVEIYSQERFIVCTGDVVVDAPIVENQPLLDMLLSEMRKGEAPILTLVDNEQIEGDEVIIQRANTAENGAKFTALANGQWEEMGYPSQSEADAALLTILAFYSKSNSQVIRIFRMTELGKREKAIKNDYYLNTSLRKVRSIAANEQVNSQVGEAMAQSLIAKLAAQGNAQAGRPAITLVHPSTAPQQATAGPQGTSTQAAGAAGAQNTQSIHGQNREHLDTLAQLYNIPSLAVSLEYPPGFAGEVAKHIYATSPRPVKEVSIIAILGLLAGVCGKAYTVSDSGLNLYIVLVAQSGVGKEAMHTGVSNIIKKVASAFPNAPDFVDFSNHASGPALSKAVAANTSFVNVCGEFGRKLVRMSNESSNDLVMQQLRTVMTDLYQKSGSNSIVGGIGYSDKEKNVASISGIAYSMIGETTPGTFYDALTDSMMSDGFLSRFTVIEYTGKRPKLNEEFKNIPMPNEMYERLVRLMTSAYNINVNGIPCEVATSPEAQKFLKAFDDRCDKEIDSTQNEGWRQMWNRAHLKVLRISALLAVADNYAFPVVHIQHATWAHDLIMRDIGIMTSRIESGDVGSSDSTREHKILALCKSYLTVPVGASYGISKEMQTHGVLPRKFLQISTQRVSCFTSHKLGQIASLDLTIRSLIDGGYIMEMTKAECVQKYNFHGKCYRILNLPVGKAEMKEIKTSQINAA